MPVSKAKKPANTKTEPEAPKTLPCDMSLRELIWSVRRWSQLGELVKLGPGTVARIADALENAYGA